jgi:hypothetical protein
MKPISTLKVYQSATTPEQLLKGFLKLMSSPKRHLRGPMYSVLPGNGKSYQMNSPCSTKEEAVSACTLGALNILTAPTYHNMRVDTQRMISATALRLYGDTSFIEVSDIRGLRAIRRVVRETLKTL